MFEREFKVSVITPVYNAEKFLRKSVESAIVLEEVGEVILVEDNSPDNALQVALQLESEYEKVHVYQHDDKGNHGAGASRNLGIKKAICGYIAFLDADDYYLPGRFKKDKVVFENIPDCEGVYDAVGTKFASQKARENFFEQGLGYQETLTISRPVKPDELFSVLFHLSMLAKGEFCTDGIVVKKEVFEKVGYFNTELRLRQDIHLWRRLAAYCNLYPGEINVPVAMRVIHEENRMTKREDHLQYVDVWWKSLKKEFKSRRLLNKNKYAIFEQAYFNHYTGSSNKFHAIGALFANVIKYPGIVKKSYGHFDYNFWKVFGKNRWTLNVISLKNRCFNNLRMLYSSLKKLTSIKPMLLYPIKINHFYNKELNYFISTNSKVMSSTLSAAPNLKPANLKVLLKENIKKKFTGISKYKFYLIVRHPQSRLESYYRNFFGLRTERLGKTHFTLEYSQREILEKLGYTVQPQDIHYKSVLETLTFQDLVKLLPQITSKDSHLIPQHFLLKWRFGKITSLLKIDRVLKMENNRDLSFIQNDLYIDITKRHNNSKQKLAIELEKTDLDMIKEVYKADYKLFDYV